MTENIDRNRVKSSFHQHASEYDQYALVQKRVVGSMLQQLSGLGISPRRILDIGSGTGRLLEGVRLIYPESMLVGADLAYGMCRAARQFLSGPGSNFVTADAELLPFADASFDLVISTSTMQWLSCIKSALGEVMRVLAPGGIFCLALFGERTLFELKSSYRRALQCIPGIITDRTHKFPGSKEVLLGFNENGFQSTKVWSELEVEYHRDVPTLLRALKRIGAGNAAATHPGGLSGRRLMTAMMAAYEEDFGSETFVPATYEVIYGMGRKCCPDR